MASLGTDHFRNRKIKMATSETTSPSQFLNESWEKWFETIDDSTKRMYAQFELRIPRLSHF